MSDEKRLAARSKAVQLLRDFVKHGVNKGRMSGIAGTEKGVGIKVMSDTPEGAIEGLDAARNEIKKKATLADPPAVDDHFYDGHKGNEALTKEETAEGEDMVDYSPEEEAAEGEPDLHSMSHEELLNHAKKLHAHLKLQHNR